MNTILLLLLSNFFMTFAWYGHLKYGHGWPLWQAILVSFGFLGGAAFFAFAFKAPSA